MIEPMDETNKTPDQLEPSLESDFLAIGDRGWETFDDMYVLDSAIAGVPGAKEEFERRQTEAKHE